MGGSATGADVVGEQRARAALNAVAGEIGIRLHLRGVPLGMVSNSDAPTSRGVQMTEEVAALGMSQRAARRVVVVRVEDQPPVDAARGPRDDDTTPSVLASGFEGIASQWDSAGGRTAAHTTSSAGFAQSSQSDQLPVVTSPERFASDPSESDDAWSIRAVENDGDLDDSGVPVVAGRGLTSFSDGSDGLASNGSGVDAAVIPRPGSVHFGPDSTASQSDPVSDADSHVGPRAATSQREDGPGPRVHKGKARATEDVLKAWRDEEQERLAGELQEQEAGDSQARAADFDEFMAAYVARQEASEAYDDAITRMTDGEASATFSALIVELGHYDGLRAAYRERWRVDPEASLVGDDGLEDLFNDGQWPSPVGGTGRPARSDPGPSGTTPSALAGESSDGRPGSSSDPTDAARTAAPRGPEDSNSGSIDSDGRSGGRSAQHDSDSESDDDSDSDEVAERSDGVVGTAVAGVVHSALPPNSQFDPTLDPTDITHLYAARNPAGATYFRDGDHQQEIAFPRGIRREYIVGAEQVLPRVSEQDSSQGTAGAVASVLGDFVANPHFNSDLPNASALPLGQDAVQSKSLYLPFDQGAKSLNRQQRSEVADFASYVVQRAAHRHAEGLSGVVLHAQGGGNGGVFSEGAEAVGLRRAGAVLDALGPEIERQLRARGLPAGAGDGFQRPDLAGGCAERRHPRLGQGGAARRRGAHRGSIARRGSAAGSARSSLTGAARRGHPVVDVRGIRRELRIGARQRR